MSDTTTCPSCSATLPAGAAFCTTCGTKIDAPAAAAEAPAPTGDDTRVDNPGLADATQVYSPPPPEPATAPAPPAPAPWQPADTGTPPPPAAWEQPAAPEPPAWTPPPAAAPPPAWEQPAAAAPAAAAWGAPGAPAVASAPPTWNQPAPPAWGAAPAPAPVPSKSSGGSPIGGILATLGGVIALVGLFTAWIKVNLGGKTLSGWDLVGKDSGFDTKDPYLLLGLGIVGIVLGLLLFTGKARTPVRILAILVGLAIIGTQARDWMDIADIAKALPSSVKITAGIGFYLGFVGAGLLILGALMPGKKSTT